MFGLSGKVLEWFRSYLKERCQRVSVQGASSNVLSLLCGVPQGLVLGPLIFAIYTRPLGITARRFRVGYHFYAEDMQLYVSLDVGSESKGPSSQENLEHCIANIRLRMTHILLKLNEGKTDIIYLSSSYNPKSPKTPGIHNAESCITPSGSVRDMGVIFDKFLDMNDHVTIVCRAAYYHLKNIRSLKPFLSQEALVKMAHAFITSRIDYCNSFLYGTSKCSLNRLQRIQNSAARILTSASKYDHITSKITLAPSRSIYSAQGFGNNLLSC